MSYIPQEPSKWYEVAIIYLGISLLYILIFYNTGISSSSFFSYARL
jgi:hypothetical protein